MDSVSVFDHPHSPGARVPSSGTVLPSSGAPVLSSGAVVSSSDVRVPSVCSLVRLVPSLLHAGLTH